MQMKMEPAAERPQVVKAKRKAGQQKSEKTEGQGQPSSSSSGPGNISHVPSEALEDQDADDIFGNSNRANPRPKRRAYNTTSQPPKRNEGTKDVGPSPRRKTNLETGTPRQKLKTTTEGISIVQGMQKTIMTPRSDDESFIER